MKIIHICITNQSPYHAWLDLLEFLNKNIYRVIKLNIYKTIIFLINILTQKHIQLHIYLELFWNFKIY